jgi:hypothetical protein
MNNKVWIPLVVVALALLGVYIFMRALDARLHVKVTAGQLDREIRDKLPLGSSRSDVEAYLDQRGMQHSYMEGAGQGSEYKHTEWAILRGASRSWLVREDIQILFKFDDNDKLVGYTVKELFTGP